MGALAPPASNINVTYVTPMVTQIRNCGVAGWSDLPLESYSRGGWVGGGMPMLPSVTFDRLNDSLILLDRMGCQPVTAWFAVESPCEIDCHSLFRSGIVFENRLSQSISKCDCFENRLSQSII